MGRRMTKELRERCWMAWLLGTFRSDQPPPDATADRAPNVVGPVRAPMPPPVARTLLLVRATVVLIPQASSSQVAPPSLDGAASGSGEEEGDIN